MAEPKVRQRQVTVTREVRPSRSRVYQPPPSKAVPFVRRRGQWLAEVGFCEGEHVKVEVEPGRLVLTPAPEAGAADG